MFLYSSCLYYKCQLSSRLSAVSSFNLQLDPKIYMEEQSPKNNSHNFED